MFNKGNEGVIERCCETSDERLGHPYDKVLKLLSIVYKDSVSVEGCNVCLRANRVKENLFLVIIKHQIFFI